MRLLSIDSSAKSAAVAVTDDDKLVSECYVNAALTHSCTLIPMVDNALKQADIDIDSVDAFCVSNGPGSFTGIRIGVAAVKGLAFPRGKKCAQVSTLESTAYNFLDENCVICPAMDARCNQVYTAFFRAEGGRIERMCEDRAISIDQLKEEIAFIDLKVILAGDGGALCFEKFGDCIPNVILASENRRYQRAYGVALAALSNNEFVDSSLIAPVYLRLPQAERELRQKKAEQSGSDIKEEKK